MGWGYTKMYRLTRAEEYADAPSFVFNWLMLNRSKGYQHYCWGNHFSFSTRSGTIPRHTPTIVWSSLIGLAFLEAYEVLGNHEYLNVASSTAGWIKDFASRANESRNLSQLRTLQAKLDSQLKHARCGATRACGFPHQRFRCSGNSKRRHDLQCARQNDDGACITERRPTTTGSTIFTRATTWIA